MIYLDDRGYPVDQTLDGGDSAVRAGILSMGNYSLRPNVLHYTTLEGDALRHPSQPPWNSPKNFSRDQLMVLTAGFVAAGYRPRVFFYRALKRFFFAQNFERDYPGTTKYPWPHRVDGKWRLFDFADPLLPNHVGALVIAGRVIWAYPLLLIGFPFHILSLVFHARSSHHEESQMIAECYIYGTLKLYRNIKPGWKEVSKKYWGKRNEIEYHEMLVKLVEDI